MTNYFASSLLDAMGKVPVISWAGVALACVSALAIGVAVELFLASGYGYEAFGVWKPPNNGPFRQLMGVAACSSLALSLACCVFVLIRGPKWPRIMVLLMLLIPCVVVLSILFARRLFYP